MNSQMGDTLKKYLKPRLNAAFYVGLIFACMIVLLTVALGNSDTANKSGLVWLVILAILSVLMALLGGNALKRMLFGQKWKEITQRQDYEQVLRDFEHAKDFDLPSLRLGDDYAYAKGFGELLDYREIERAWEYRHVVNGFDVERELRIIRAGSDRKLLLCKLKKSGRDDGSVRQAILFMLQKNPDLKLGYKD